MGSLGAVMDVGISIASSIEEIHRTNPSLPSKNLFLSGMNVGKDIIGTMTNTLILAYTGSSIPLLIVFMAYETSMAKYSIWMSSLQKLSVPLQEVPDWF